jgi:hypothetical protein
MNLHFETIMIPGFEPSSFLLYDIPRHSLKDYMIMVRTGS